MMITEQWSESCHVHQLTSSTVRIRTTVAQRCISPASMDTERLLSCSLYRQARLRISCSLYRQARLGISCSLYRQARLALNCVRCRHGYQRQLITKQLQSRLLKQHLAFAKCRLFVKKNIISMLMEYDYTHSICQCSSTTSSGNTQTLCYNDHCPLSTCTWVSRLPLILLLHFLSCASFQDRPKLSTSFLQYNQVFFGRPLCLIPSTSHVIQRLTQSLSFLRSTCPNHLNLLFIIKLTGSNPKSYLSSSLFFLSFSLTQHNHIHLIILISVRFSFNSCSTFIGQVSLPCIRQLTQLAFANCLSVLMRIRFSQNGQVFTKLFPSRSDSSCYY